MTIYFMLTLDLNGNVSTDAREKFYAVLRANNLQRRGLTTTWSGRFSEDHSTSSAERVLKDVLKGASAASGVLNYEFGYMYSSSPMKEESSIITSLLGSLV